MEKLINKLRQLTTIPGKGKGQDFSSKDLRGINWSNQKSDISYEVILKEGKALDRQGNLLREELLLGNFKGTP
jgi:hypothetical protein